MSSAQIDSDEFQAWLAHPCTQALFQKCDRIGKELREQWLRESWNRDIDNKGLPLTRLAYLRGKSDTFASVLRLKYQDLFGPLANDERNQDLASGGTRREESFRNTYRGGNPL